MKKKDMKKWAENTLVFLAPALLVFLASLGNAIPAGWKYGALTLYALNVLTDLLKKYIQSKK